MTVRLSLLLALLAGCPVAGTDPDAVDTDAVDTDDPEDTDDTDPLAASIDATCGPSGDTGERVDSTRIEGAEVRCDEDTCVVALTSEAPTRREARGSSAGLHTFTLPGWEFGALLVATADGVSRLQVGRESWAPSAAGTVWLVAGDVLREVRPDGVVVRRCPLPAPAYEDLVVVAEVDGELLLSGLVADRIPRLLRSSTDGWREISLTDVFPTGFAPHRPGHALFGGYGRYGAWSLDEDSGEALGGSDDLFDRFAVCADHSYWVGGGTGLTWACTADHACTWVDAPDAPFQAPSTRCDARGRLVFFHGIDNTPVYTLGRDGTLTEEARPEGLRHFSGQRGHTWRVVDKE